MRVNPTSLMFGAVLFAFLFYITVRGDLAKWLGLLGLAGSTPANAAPAVNTGATYGMPGLTPMAAMPDLRVVGGTDWTAAH